VAAGFGAYRTVLADPRARAFSLAGFVARMPVSMIALSIVLLVSAVTGSYGRAGIITGTATLTGAVAAPAWGRLIDRMGQARVLVTAALICNLSLALLAVTVLLRWPLVVTLVTAVGVGLGFSSAGSCVRARWAYRLQGDPLLNTAYALEAVVDEGVFIVGPVLATFLCTNLHPALGLAAAVVLGLIGAFRLASLRDTEPPRQTAAEARAAKAPLSARRLLPVVLTCLGLGALFGGMELVVVAFAREAGIPRYTGVIVMVWATGSLVAGLLTGTVVWRASPARRFRMGALLLGLSVVPLPFAHDPFLVTGLLLLSGFFIAPTLIAAIAVTHVLVPATRLTEALGWTSTGMAAGVAVGAATLGQVVDRFDAGAGFWGVVVIGGLLILATLGVRTPRPASPEVVEQPSVPGGPALLRDPELLGRPELPGDPELVGEAEVSVKREVSPAADRSGTA
jgi:MFS family permease